MTILPDLIARFRRSRIALVAVSAAAGLALSLAAPSVMSALGGSSPPVGCFSDVVGSHSDPCVLTPVDDDGGDDSGSDDSGPGVAGTDVVGATPTFTG